MDLKRGEFTLLKKFVAIYFIIILSVIPGCSNFSDKTQKKEEINKGITGIDPYTLERDYILVSSNSANTMEASIDSMLTLVEEININDIDWRSNIQDAVSEINMSASLYYRNRNFLTPELQKKFAGSIESYTKCFEIMTSIYKQVQLGIENNNEDIFTNMSSNLTEASTLLQQGNDFLEIEKE